MGELHNTSGKWANSRWMYDPRLESSGVGDTGAGVMSTVRWLGHRVGSTKNPGTRSQIGRLGQMCQ